MSHRVAKIAFEKRLNDNWTLSRVKWPNQPFEPVVDADGNVQPYIAFHRRESEGRLITLNEGQISTWHRYTGVLVHQIFVPENSSDALTAVYTDALSDIWRGKEFSYVDPDTEESSGVIRTRIPYEVPVGIDEGWYQVNVITNYIRDDQDRMKPLLHLAVRDGLFVVSSVQIS